MISRCGAGPGMPNGSDSPCTTSVGTVTPSSSGIRVFSGRPGGCTGNARHSTADRLAVAGGAAGHPRAGRPAAEHQRQVVEPLVGQPLGDREPGRVELLGRCGRPAARDPVGLLDQRDVHAGGPRGPGGGDQVGRADPAAGAVPEQQPGAALGRAVQLRAGRARAGCRSSCAVMTDCRTASGRPARRRFLAVDQVGTVVADVVDLAGHRPQLERLDQLQRRRRAEQLGRRPRRPGRARPPTASGVISSGIRSWMSASWPTASVVSTAALTTGGPSGRLGSRHTVHRPAIARLCPSGRVMKNGCLSAALPLPLEPAVGGQQAPPLGQRRAERRGRRRPSPSAR